MKLRNLALGAATMLALGQLAGAAYAQTKIFVIDEGKIQHDSKIGQDIATKLGDIKKQGVTKLGLDTMQTEIKTEDDALKPQTENLSKEALAANATLKARVDALNKKKAEFLQKAEFLDQNLQQQQGAANAAFAQALAPAVDYVGKEAGADVVLSSQSTWYFKTTIDLSAKVTARLDATTPTLASLPQPAGQPAPSAPAGAAKPAAAGAKPAATATKPAKP